MHREYLIPDKALTIMRLLKQAGATDVFIVGGFVRDSIIGITSKDVDIEVYGLTWNQVVNSLGKTYNLDIVGESFGVLKIDNEVDVSLPRKENKIGVGHKAFDVIFDINMNPAHAAIRRDFTINTIMMREDGTIFDPCDGVKDLLKHKDGVTRLIAPSIAFVEDPLRVLRGMQLASRFHAICDDANTLNMCSSTMRNEYSSLAKERIWEEWKKFALKGGNAHLGIKFLKDTAWLVLYPQLEALDIITQKEGSLLSFTTAALQRAINMAISAKLLDDDRIVLFFSALCHLMSMDDPFHFMESIGAPKKITAHIVRLVANKLLPLDPTDKDLKRLSVIISPSNIRMLLILNQVIQHNENFAEYFDVAKNLDILECKLRPIVSGEDLIKLGYKTGPVMGVVLNQIFEAQINGEFDNREDAMKWINTNKPVI